MKKSKKIYLDFEIDKLTNSIENELLIDPRPLKAEEKDRIREFIQNYSQKSLKIKSMNLAKKRLNKKTIKA